MQIHINVGRTTPAPFTYDSSKKTLAILGSGWAATSILKSLDSSLYNVVCLYIRILRLKVVISPRNYFLFTPLLPSCTVGTLELRSIMQPIRYITRHHQQEVKYVEGRCSNIDHMNRKLTVSHSSEIAGSSLVQQISYDYLVIACGADNTTFNVPGVKEHACFLKEAWDARKIRRRLMDAVESAAFPNQSDEQVERLLHMVVVGGGPVACFV